MRISDWSSDVCSSDLCDTAGALSIGRAGTASPAGWRVVEREDDLERIINELPSKPFLIGQNGVSMSLAGVQSKLGVAVDPEGRICIPTDGSPSTHILKPDSTRLDRKSVVSGKGGSVRVEPGGSRKITT